MPELFLELFSEEIPARMQSRAADDLSRLCAEALAPLAPANVRSFHGPRRIALASDVSPQVATSNTTERGPRTNAPEQALAGFLRKHGASREQMRQEGDYWVLRKTAEPVQAATLIASTMPALLRRFPWPTSMRWGGASNFVWVRPLRRIVCLLDGRVVPFDLRDGEDDGHGLASDDLTEGHRFHAPDAFPVISCADWEAKLRKHRVLVDADERRRAIRDGIGELGGARRITPVDDPGLLDEVAGLVEWPVPLLGRIDDAFMDLPAEVRQVSMRVNQRYFAFRHADGSAAPYFGFVANIEPADGGAASIAGNERVLRARFADARYFWDLDRKARLESRVPLLDHVTFHARLGSQGERVRRLERLVADAIRDHYAPKGPADAVPTADVSIAVALADKLDLLVGFFAISERPTGAGDPYALRRAALGIIRIIRENGLWIRLVALIELAGQAFHHRGVHPVPAQEVLDFLAERLRMTLRAEGKRHDVLAAVFAAGADDVIPRLLSRTEAVAALLETDNGANLLTAYRRAANIIRIEARKDGPHDGAPSEALARIDEERGLFRAIADADADISACLRDDNYETALGVLADLRSPLDAFFDKVTVNAQEPELRLNRLRLLHKVRSTMDRIADFSKIEG